MRGASGYGAVTEASGTGRLHCKDGDSLWSIAKENHTTVEDILRDNHRTDEDLRRGEKILIVKKVELNSYES